MPQVVASDKTGLMVEVLNKELEKFVAIKEKFVDEFSLEDFDYIDLLYALQTFVLSVFIRIVIFFIIATVIKLCTGRRIGFKLVLLIVFGSLKSPRCILIMSEFSYMPYMKLFNHSLLYLIIISTLVGGLASKWIVRVLDEEGESGNTSEEDFQPNGA